MQSTRMVVRETEDYRVDLEYNEDYWIFHLPYVNRMTKTVLQDLTFIAEDWTNLANTSGYKGIFAAIPEDVKLDKLLQKLGFAPLGVDPNTNFIVYRRA